MTPLPVKPAIELESQAKEAQWLVEGLWGDGAVGILGGEPKCCKSFMALDLAVSVSSGTPCLGRFKVDRPGRVLLYAAEDAQAVVKRRLLGIALARGVELGGCDIQVITAERLRLDTERDMEALGETVAALKPKLLILDPFVRLHRIDENSSAEVAVILENLRVMQRRHGVAILVVHHAKKNGGSARAGQALRGSSEFHAWGDSNLYMRRFRDELTLSVEHRAAASKSGIPVALHAGGEALALAIKDYETAPPPPPKTTPADKIELVLKSAGEPLNLLALREKCGIRTATLCETLKEMQAAGRIERADVGYTIARQPT